MKKPFLSFFRALAFTGVAASLIFITSCGSDDDPAPGTDPDPTVTNTIWEEVQGRDNLTLLEAELLAAGLDGALNQDSDELTLFAPTDAAMELLLSTLGLENFDPVNPLIAQAVLTYHVVPGIVRSSDLTVGGSLTTLQGEAISVVGGPELSTGATSNSGFVTTDIETVNGVIHLIDVVMVPPTIGGQIVATLGTVAQPVLLGADFTILRGAIQKADTFLTSQGEATLLSLLANGDLAGDDQITVFAPTNATFNAAGITTATYDGETWSNILKHHVVQGQGGGTDDGISTLGPDDLTQGSSFTSLLGLSLDIYTGTPTNGLGIYIDSNGDFAVGEAGPTGFNAEVALADADGGSSNGRIHVIAGVLAPPAPPQ